MPQSDLRPDLVLLNARVIAMGPRGPAADAVAVRHGRVVWMGGEAELPSAGLAGATVIDCGGQTLLPGFIDAHCHLLAYASSLLAVDCRPGVVGSIQDIQRALRERAENTPPGRWIRGAGYDEVLLVERRHPTRWELDAAVPHHPVKLSHGSGHACILNSVALGRAGISSSTLEPERGAIDREPDTGEPTGLLLEMDEHLEEVVPPLEETRLCEGLQIASRRLLSYGVTSVQDATHSNSPDRWDLLSRARSRRVFLPRVTMMAGARHLEAFAGRGLPTGAGEPGIDLGAVKVMLSAAVGELAPSPGELGAEVRRAAGAGFQVAIHAVEAEAVETAIAALADLGGDGVGRRHRIEHLSECSQHALAGLGGSGVMVVTNPAFIHHRGRRYLDAVEPRKLAWLYRIGSLRRAGVAVAAGSDAPVVEPNPLVAISTAITRKSSEGQIIGEREGVSAVEALRLCTLGAAYAGFQERDRGSIEVGKLADLVLLHRDPTRLESEEIADIKVSMTILGGDVAWEA